MGETENAPIIDPNIAPLLRVIRRFEDVKDVDFSLFTKDKKHKKIKEEYFNLYEKIVASEDDYIQTKKPEKGIFVFDFNEFCKKYNMDLEKVRAMYEEVRDLTFFDSKARHFHSGEDWELLDVEYVGIKKMVDYLKAYSEEELFTKWCKNSNLKFTNVRNVHRIDYKKMNDNGDWVTKTIATYTRPLIEDVRYFTGKSFENRQILKIKDAVIDLTDQYNYFDEFIKAVKKTGNFPYELYLDQYSQLYDYIKKRYTQNTETIKRTAIYGYFGKDKIIFHDWELDKESPRANDFKELLKLDPDKEEIKELLIDLKKYFGDEDFIKIIFEYGLASIFRHDLMKNKKLDKFPFLLVQGKQAIGKTARMNLVFNKLLLNSDTPYLRDDLEGSPMKLAKEQFINIPYWLDELQEFPPKLGELVKQMATQTEGIITRGNKDITKADYASLVKRPFIVSTNKFTIHDPAIQERFIILSAYDYELENHSEIALKILPDVNKIGSWIYKNIEIIKEHVDTLQYSRDRDRCNDNTIMIGREIAKCIFKQFGLEYEGSKNIIYGESSIHSSSDKIRKAIIENVIKLSEWLDGGVKRNVLDYIEENSHITPKLQLQKYGIFIEKDRLNNYSILVTKTALEYLKLEDIGIKTIAEFEAHGFKRRQKWHNTKNYYCVEIPIGEQVEDPERARIRAKVIEIIEENNKEGNKTHIAHITVVLRDLFSDNEDIEDIIEEMKGTFLTNVNGFLETTKNPQQKVLQ